MYKLLPKALYTFLVIVKCINLNIQRKMENIYSIFKSLVEELVTFGIMRFSVTLFIETRLPIQEIKN